MKKKSASSRIALVTGGNSGIGQAIATKFCKEEFRVVVADIAAPTHHTDSIYKHCDITSGESVADLFAYMDKQKGLPDILVLNAGRGIHETLHEGDPEKWKAVLDLNIMGALRCIRAFVPHMMQQQYGEVILISSVAAERPYTYGGVYSASKAALEAIADTLRLETMPHVRVTVISAGVTDTNFFKNQISGSDSIETIGCGSIAPEEIAEDAWYAINKPAGTVINKITTRPIAQHF